MIHSKFIHKQLSINHTANYSKNTIKKIEEIYFNSRNYITEELFDGLKQVGVDFNGKRVLDLGAGPGFLSAMLSDKGAVVDALEPSEAFRNMGKSYTNGKNVTFYDGL